MDLVLFAQQYNPYFVGVHLLGVVLGFGGALISDVLFIKFLKDLKIEDVELKILKTMSKIIWMGLLIIVISGVFLFLSDIERYSVSAKFLVKMIVVGIIIVNGALLNFVVTPKLTQIQFGEFGEVGDIGDVQGIRNLRRLAFASGAVSMTSWWTAFILGLMHRSPTPFHVLLGIYLIVVAGAIVSSQILEKLISTRKINPPGV